MEVKNLQEVAQKAKHMSINDVLRYLGVDPKRGLSEEEPSAVSKR